MSGTTLAKSSVPKKTQPYFGFQGIDDSRDPASMDTGEKQALVAMDNCYADWQGLIVTSPGFKRRRIADGFIKLLTFYGQDKLVWAQEEDGYIALDAEASNCYYPDAFPRGSVVSSTVFNHKVFFAARAATPIYFTGSEWKEITSPNVADPKYLCAIQRRLAMAGMAGYPTQVWFSRVDDENTWPDDEAPDAPEVTKASFIDIANLIGSSDFIKGIAAFDANRMAIFTNDRALVYQIDADYTTWQLDDRTNVNFGTISHNTIRNVAGDLFFCSRIGVHSLRRSAYNGISLYTVPVSAKVKNLYKKLVRETDDPESITATYNQDAGQYNVFFPRPGGTAVRLVFSLSPLTDGIGNIIGTWSTASAIGATCGAFMGGVMVLGGTGGIWQEVEVDGDGVEFATSTFTTPILWHGTITDPKQSKSLIIQASGTGRIFVEGFDDKGRSLSSRTIEVNTERGVFPTTNLTQSAEYPFEHSYRGVQLRFTIETRSAVKITGFAVNLKV